MHDKLTLVSPIALRQRERLQEARDSFYSFYKALGSQRPRHLICSANSWWYDRKFRRLLSRVGANWEPIATGATAYEGFIAMVEATETEYLFPILSDVKTMVERDFISPCIAAMEADPSLVQVRVCGHPFASAKTNTAFLVSHGERVTFRDHP